MSREIVTLPKEEYELLIRCRHIVESEFEEKFSDEFIKDVKESEESYRNGEFVKITCSKDRKKLFNSL